MKEEELKNEIKNLKSQVKERTAGYILAGLGFVAGLAWNDAVQSLIAYFLPLSKNTITAKFIYAVVVTAIIVTIGTYFLKAPDKK